MRVVAHRGDVDAARRLVPLVPGGARRLVLVVGLGLGLRLRATLLAFNRSRLVILSLKYDIDNWRLFRFQDRLTLWINYGVCYVILARKRVFLKR